MIQSRQDLMDYCLKKLGAPVMHINVDIEQVEDRIDDAIQFYQDYHSDALVKTYRKHQITQDDVDAKAITIPENMIFVQRIFPLKTSSTSGAFSAQYKMMADDVWGMNASVDLSNYVIMQQYVSLVEQQLNGVGAERIRFNRHTNKLHIDTNWATDLPVGDYIVIEGNESIDPETFTDIYNDRFLKKYATALIKQQWGMNLIKFEGMELPGGVTMNGRQMYDDATAEIEKIEEEMISNYELPVDFMVG